MEVRDKLKVWFRYLVAILLVLGWNIPVFAQNIGQLKVDISKVPSARNLVERSSLIVVGRPAIPQEEYPTGVQIESGKITNYVQKVFVRTVLKGTSDRIINVLTTGVNPLPKPSDPINNIYPGPIAQGGNYAFFLKPVTGTKLYQIIGVWQGVYPFINGKTIALQGFGFSEFNNLTPNQLQSKIHSFAR